MGSDMHDRLEAKSIDDPHQSREKFRRDPYRVCMLELHEQQSEGGLRRRKL
jgi:hypothetical protein